MGRLSIELDDEQTRAWESGDAAQADDARRGVRLRAQAMADETRQTVEVYAADGVVLDAIDPR